ncbi:MAG TPA: IclR family transcriptional regulator [Burkholderiales bacterium]|nr:IclR family transcriptional regulator [Burkholderiales bacterium]
MEAKTRRGVDAIERALQLLDSFRTGAASLSLAELSARTGFYKSTILRIFVSLERYGYLARLDNGQFALGATLFELGSVYQRSYSLGERVRPVLAKLAAQTRESASFWALESGHRVCLCRVESPQAVREAIFREGDRRELDNGPTSTLLRAFSGARGRRFDKVRRNVAAVSLGLYRPDVAGISCPVFSAGGALGGAVTLTGPRQRIDERAIARMKGPVRAAAEEITRSLGGAVPWK